MFIKSISGNKITVRRGEDGTQIETHLGGTEIHAINAADNALIEVGDDFGFEWYVLMKMTKNFDELNDTFNT